MAVIIFWIALVVGGSGYWANLCWCDEPEKSCRYWISQVGMVAALFGLSVVVVFVLGIITIALARM